MTRGILSTILALLTGLVNATGCVAPEAYDNASVPSAVSTGQPSAAPNFAESSATVSSELPQVPPTAAPVEDEPGEESGEAITVTVNDVTFRAVLSDTDAAAEFHAWLLQGPVTLNLSDYGDMEKVGPLGRSLAVSNRKMTTQPGDIVLYNGSNIVMFYGTNTWDYTPIATVEDLTGWADALGSGDITVVFSAE